MRDFLQDFILVSRLGPAKARSLFPGFRLECYERRWQSNGSTLAFWTTVAWQTGKPFSTVRRDRFYPLATSHALTCLEVKKRAQWINNSWSISILLIISKAPTVYWFICISFQIQKTVFFSLERLYTFSCDELYSLLRPKVTKYLDM